MNIDLIIVLVGLILMLSTGQHLGRKGIDFTPVFALYCLGLFLALGGMALIMLLHH